MGITVEMRGDGLRSALWRPLNGFSRAYLLALAAALLVGAWGLGCWGYQIVRGIGVAGIRRPTMWGFYLVNFVFWIGISHAGTMPAGASR
jgi:molybdopterin-containing oxidoreductase family membrane subunit